MAPMATGSHSTGHRPEAEWPLNQDGAIAMPTEFLDLRALVAEAV
jgi:hypothetical protein